MKNLENMIMLSRNIWTLENYLSQAVKTGWIAQILIRNYILFLCIQIGLLIVLTDCTTMLLKFSLGCSRRTEESIGSRTEVWNLYTSNCARHILDAGKHTYTQTRNLYKPRSNYMHALAQHWVLTVLVGKLKSWTSMALKQQQSENAVRLLFDPFTGQIALMGFACTLWEPIWKFSIACLQIFELPREIKRTMFKTWATVSKISWF